MTYPDGSHFARSLLDFIKRSIQNSSAANHDGAEKSNTMNDTNSGMDEDSHWFPITDIDPFYISCNWMVLLISCVREMCS
jgi:hypothetical protein